MDHVILTRFNLPSAGAESVVRAKHGWLTERIELFENYCLPSVLAQTERRFRWLIYFDPESPAWLKERIASHAGHYVPVFRMQVGREELMADISDLFAAKGDELLTSNLDNDDGLAVDFVERLQSQPRPATSTAYYLSNGLIKSPDGLFHHHDRHNAFASVRSRWQSPITCWADWHNRLANHMPVVEVEGAPGWLQVVHGGNVSNRTRGRLVSPKPYGELFGTSLDDVAEPGGRTLLRDRFVGHPLRMARDRARFVVKTAVLKVLGADGFERAKRLLAARAKTGAPS
jgi:hypothetical protein